MGINRTALKSNSKIRILSTKPSPLIVVAIYVIISYVLDILRSNLDGTYQMTQETYNEYLLGNFDYLPEYPGIGVSGIVLVVAIVIMTVVLHAGFVIYCMKICQGEKAGYRNLFDGFNIFFKVLWLDILMGIFIMLWSMLFIIPGIIAAYRYRMALYTMIDHPELSALDCIRRSKEMMTGRKGELFRLDLSFIGWRLLSSFPLVSFWVTPYTGVTYTYYYIALRDMPLNGYRDAGEGGFSI